VYFLIFSDSPPHPAFDSKMVNAEYARLEKMFHELDTNKVTYSYTSILYSEHRNAKLVCYSNCPNLFSLLHSPVLEWHQNTE
jgi:hypothetical protein